MAARGQVKRPSISRFATVPPGGCASSPWHGRRQYGRPRRTRWRHGGGGLQSMGLGSAANRDGAFGEFRGAGGLAGLRLVAAIEEARSREIAVPVGETIELTIPAVCLNFGLRDAHPPRPLQTH